MIRHRWVIIATWAVIFVVSGWTMSGLSALLTNRFSIPGSDTARAEKILHDQFGQRSDGAFQLIFKASPGTDVRQAVPEVRAAAKRAAAAVPTGRFVSAQPIA